MTLEEFDAELVARGFDGYEQSERFRYINWGYFHVAKLTKWFWEQTSEVRILFPGAYRLTLPVTFGQLKSLSCTTEGYTRSLTPMPEPEFQRDWLSNDLTLSQFRGEPGQYFLFGGDIWVLPPPVDTRDYLIHFWQKPVPLQLSTTFGGANIPITPDHFDEAIFLGALARCQQRAKDTNAVRETLNLLLESFDLDISEQTERFDEEDERVVPDRFW